MRVAIVGTPGVDSKVMVDRLDHLTSKLTKPTFLVLPKQGYVEDWLFARMLAYEIFHEGMEPMMESADALIVFGRNREARDSFKLAERRGIKIKRVL